MLLKRGKKLRSRRKFKSESNPLKTYRRKFTDYQVMIRAEICRQRRLADPTQAELAFAQILTNLNIPYTREAIIQNGDRFVLIDFLCVLPAGDTRVALEVDGSSHAQQKEYDAGRTAYLATKGINVVRFTNKQVLKKPLEVIEILQDLWRVP